MKFTSQVIENPTEKKVKYIYHLSDLNIRYNEHQDEYQEIFKKLYSTIEADNCKYESIMVICGNVFHNFDRFSNVNLLLFNELIKNITKYMEIFVIPGNHDSVVLSNISVLGSYQKFHFLEKSGIYNFSNLSMYVSSILDGNVIQQNPNIDKNNCVIALHHGVICGSDVISNNFPHNKCVKINNFKNYDIVLLGGHHKRHFLNSKKTIAYSGTLIQQNFEEELDHGFLKWNVETKSSVFVKLDNDYSYVNVSVNSIISSINFTNFSRIRLLLDYENLKHDNSRIIEEIGKYTSIISIKKYLVEKEVLIFDEINTIESFLDIKNKEDILKLHYTLLKNIDYDKCVYSNKTSWYIEKLEFKNIFSYGDNILNTVNLKNGLTNILSDSVGKTNIFNIIIYGLFGLSKVQNHINKNIINRYTKKDPLFVKLTVKFFLGEKCYIERTARKKTRNRIKSSEDGKVDITETLHFYNDNINLDLSTKIETEKLMKNMLSILDKDEFVFTNVMSNTIYGGNASTISNVSIISLSGIKLEDMFNKLFNFSKYKSLNEMAKTYAKKLEDKITTNTAIFNTTTTTDTIELIQKLNKELELYKIYIDITQQTKIPKTMVTNIINSITHDANILIYNCTGLLCYIQDNYNMEIVIKKDNIVFGPDYCSSYERFIINTALKISFNKHKKLSNINLFIIDEAIDYVFENNIDQIDNLLLHLYKNFCNVLLISNNKILHTRINNNIVIKSTDKCSVIS